MPDAIDISLLIIAAGAWCLALVAGVALLRYRRQDISLLRLWFDGARWFRRDTFRPEAAPAWRLFIGGAIVFAVCLAIVAVRFAMR
jgi:uncharacterized iron-regulated membrane protein